MFIHEIEIQCNDLSKAENFYKSKLGLKILKKSDSSISFQVGVSILSFHFDPEVNPVYHFAFNIPCNKIEEAEKWIETRADILEAGNLKIVDFKNWNARSVYFSDSLGNVLEFIARHDLKNESDLPFDSNSFLSISEIGIVTENIKNTCRDLYEKYKIPVFAKQPVLENFAVLGDDNGLIILSIPKRHWYPTEIEASKFSLTATIEQNNSNFELRF